MTAFPVNMMACSFQGADNRTLTFLPTGEIRTWDDAHLMDARRLPAGVLSARFLVRLRTAKERPLCVEDLAKLVSQVATGKPFAIQRGVFRSGEGERPIEEAAAQFVMVDIEALGRQRFLEAMEGIATRLSKLLGGEWVFAEAQVQGIGKGFLTASSWGPGPGAGEGQE